MQHIYVYIFFGFRASSIKREIISHHKIVTMHCDYDIQTNNQAAIQIPTNAAFSWYIPTTASGKEKLAIRKYSSLYFIAAKPPDFYSNAIHIIILFSAQLSCKDTL